MTTGLHIALLHVTATLIRFWWQVTGNPKRRLNGRHHELGPALCVTCGAVFRWRDARHGYEPDEDCVRPADYCRKCGNEL